MYRERREWGELLLLRRRLKRVFRQRCLCAGQMMSREYATVLSVAERKIAVVDTELVFCRFSVSGGSKRAILGNILKIFLGSFWLVFDPLKPTVYGGGEAQILTRIGAEFCPLEALAG